MGFSINCNESKTRNTCKWFMFFKVLQKRCSPEHGGRWHYYCGLVNIGKLPMWLKCEHHACGSCTCACMCVPIPGTCTYVIDVAKGTSGCRWNWSAKQLGLRSGCPQIVQGGSGHHKVLKSRNGKKNKREPDRWHLRWPLWLWRWTKGPKKVEWPLEAEKAKEKSSPRPASKWNGRSSASTGFQPRKIHLDFWLLQRQDKNAAYLSH